MVRGGIRSWETRGDSCAPWARQTTIIVNRGDRGGPAPAVLHGRAAVSGEAATS